MMPSSFKFPFCRHLRIISRTLLLFCLLLFPDTTIYSFCNPRSMSSTYQNDLVNKQLRNYQRFFLSLHDDEYGKFECERLRHPFDKDLYDFYRNNFSSKKSKRFVPSLPGRRNTNDKDCDKHDYDDDDAVYVLRSATTSPKNEIVAALRLTRAKADVKDNNNYTFLRSLCVSHNHRKQGLALHLLRVSCQDFDNECCYYCFASSELEGLYQRCGFNSISSSIADSSTTTNHTYIPKWLDNSFNTMANRWERRGKKTLNLFIKHPCPNIILLQHRLELRKNTATGFLVDDDLFHQTIGDETRKTNAVQLSHRLSLERWVWSGRNNTVIIEDQINQLGCSCVFLLWTGGSSSNCGADEDVIEERGTVAAQPPPTYVILDGTWQQAQTMFRRIPSFWNLPRISLSNAPRSIYTLRKDYSGWRDRFSGTPSDDCGTDDNLLCTAEVIAALLERNGDIIGANEIRRRLDTFQTNFQQIIFERKRANRR